MLVLAIVMIIDIITGFSKCYLKKSEKNTENGIFKSSIMRECGVKKFLICVLAIGIDFVFSYYYKSVLIPTMCYTYFIANEFLSIFENLKICGLKIPNFLVKFFEDEQDRSDKDDTQS